MRFDEIDQELAEARAVIEPEFDVDFYLDNSPDLRDCGVDPVMHYLQHGWREHRDPSREFSTSFYLAVNSDVVMSDMNPFLHYLSWGRAEGRPGLRPPSYDGADAYDQPQPETITQSQPVDDPAMSDLSIIAAAFDVDYYLEQSPDLRGMNVDLAAHYFQAGWREQRDPARNFSTSYYLESNPDIRSAGINPFLHYLKYGRAEGRAGLSYSAQLAQQYYRPLVSVIIPNYNHARFLRQRINCIISQGYRPFEIVILDDCSTDDSAALIEQIRDEQPDLIRTIVNPVNSGGVFKQWRKGVEACRGEIIWICESDDFCDLDFLETIIPSMVDRSVMIAFGRIQFADAQGNMMPGLDAYREEAEPKIWDTKCVRTAYRWFNGAFAVSNVIANVGGCVFRKQSLPEPVWQAAQNYKILGDWYLYVMLSEGGRIAYVPEAVTYFRQHGKNTSVKSFHTQAYYREHADLITLLRERWGVSNATAIRFGGNVIRTYEYANAEPHVGDLAQLFSFDRVFSQKRKSKHVLIAFLGFHLGGGELFPIHLANELLRREFVVSVMCLDTRNENSRVRSMLDPRIAIYEARQIEELGIASFIEDLGVDIIHSHGIGIEFFFFRDPRQRIKVPYLVTLHGSYEVTPISDDILLRMIRGVSHWIYLSQKNLDHLRGLPLSSNLTSFIGNGMPLDPRPAARSRAELGIECDDLVFTVISRAIKEKGWREAILAVGAAQSRINRKLHLILCGSGNELEVLEAEYQNLSYVHFLGFQETVHGIFRISDCAMLPTRFRGESFPLSLIQAMQVGTPIIATSVGEIDSMLCKDGREAGITIVPSEDDEMFVAHLASAILMMADDSFRAERAKDSGAIGQAFDLETVAAKYISVYNHLIAAPLRDTGVAR